MTNHEIKMFMALHGWQRLGIRNGTSRIGPTEVFTRGARILYVDMRFSIHELKELLNNEPQFTNISYDQWIKENAQ